MTYHRAIGSPKAKKQKSLLGPVGVALIVFAIGCGVLLFGLAASNNMVMLAGGIVMGASGGLAALLGERISQDFVKFQGGGPAKKAREEAERKSDTTHTDLTVPEEWQDPPTRG